MQKDAFKPQGREVPVMGMGPVLGGGGGQQRMIPMAPPPAQGRAPQQQQPTPVTPRGGGAPISDRSGAFKPMGQPVRIMGGANPALEGGAVDRGASFQPSQPAMVQAPSADPSPEMAGVAPRPFMQRREGGSMIMRVILSGIGPDGNPYAAPYDAEFVPGSHSFRVDFSPLT